MRGEVDLKPADREVLIGIIVSQQAIIEGLEKWIVQLEGRAKSGGSAWMPGLKPKGDRKPDQPKKPRKRRPHGFARAKMAPNRRVEHVAECCLDCGSGFARGWGQRIREVIDLPRFRCRSASASTSLTPVRFAGAAAFPPPSWTEWSWAKGAWGSI